MARSGPLDWGLCGELKLFLSVENQHVTKCYTGPQTWQACANIVIMILQVP